MAEETIQIIKIDTTPASLSVKDLRNNIKILKDQIAEAEIGTTDYTDKLNELKLNQNALKDAMYATSASLQDVVDSASGASKSYNSLVHRMASLKEEFRATNDVARRNELGQQIKEINDQLKEMDALQGNFQRNVGNYQSAFKGWAENVDVLRKSLSSAQGGLNGLKDGMEGISKSPAVATFGILVSTFIKLADEIKKDETATEALKKGMNALKPVMDFISSIVSKLAEILADVIDKVSTFVTNNGLLQKIINGVMGVGNAIFQYITAPLQGVIAAIKVFREQGVKGLGDAAKAFAGEMKSGFAFKQNFQAGQAMGDAIIKGAKSKKDDAVNAGKELGEKVKEGIKLADVDKALAEGDRKLEADRKARLDDQKLLDQQVLEEWESVNAEIDAFYAEEAALRAKDLEDAKQKAAEKIATMDAVASSTSSILGSLADMYEADEEQSEKNAGKIKALRVAEATINTISGAVKAFMANAENPIIAAAQAAAITAAGFAQIAKIKNTKVGTGDVSTASVSAITSAPTASRDFPQIRSITSASEEARLNYMAKDQKVFLVMSELQMAQDAQKVQIAEASF